MPWFTKSNTGIARLGEGRGARLLRLVGYRKGLRGILSYSVWWI